MTRKQAEKIAQTLRAEAEKAGRAGTDPKWETVTLTDPTLVEKVLEAPQLVYGCLSLGWGFSIRGHSEITVRRPPR